MAFGNSTEGIQITEDDLFAFTSGKSQPEEISSYIQAQRQLNGSKIKEWFDDLARRLDAAPEDIAWGAFGQEDGE